MKTSFAPIKLSVAIAHINEELVHKPKPSIYHLTRMDLGVSTDFILELKNPGLEIKEMVARQIQYESSVNTAYKIHSAPWCLNRSRR